MTRPVSQVLQRPSSKDRGGRVTHSYVPAYKYFAQDVVSLRRVVDLEVLGRSVSLVTAING